MKHFTTILYVTLFAAFIFNSCKKDDSKEAEQAQKTLDKYKLLGKQWSTHNGIYKHEFKYNGEYLNGGTWEWKNNSDTMIIDIDGYDDKYKPVLWKFFWSEDHEMACKVVIYNSDEILFKDQPW